jgi:ribosome-binding factor A
MGTFRMARINKQLQREISLLLEQRVKSDVARNAVITGVECARDLEFARVYFTTINSADREVVLAELRKLKGALRSMLGQILELRHIPALEFMIDQSLDYGERIDGILQKLGLDSVANDEEFEAEDDEDEEEDGEVENREAENRDDEDRS